MQLGNLGEAARLVTSQLLGSLEICILADDKITWRQADMVQIRGPRMRADLVVAPGRASVY